MAEKMTYKWGTFAPLSSAASAQAVGEEFERIIDATGSLTAPAVLAEARPDGALLHPFFEWDDDAAAENYRLEQARRLIVNVQVTVVRSGSASKPVRAFVSLSDGLDAAQGFKPIQEVVANPRHREMLLDRALNELNEWRRKYQELQEFVKLFGYIDVLVSAKEELSRSVNAV